MQKQHQPASQPTNTNRQTYKFTHARIHYINKSTLYIMCMHQVTNEEEEEVEKSGSS